MQNLSSKCTINDKKSFIISSPRIVFFGVIIGSIEIIVSSTDKTIDKILTQFILSNIEIRMRQLALMIGLLINACNAIFEGPLHYRTLERLQKKKS